MTGETCELYRETSGVCGRPAVGRYLTGWLCDEDAPPQPETPPGWPDTLRSRPGHTYGTATTDPLGRVPFPDSKTGKINPFSIPKYPCHNPACHLAKGHKNPCP